MFRCGVCSHLEPTFSKLCGHLGRSHSHETNLCLPCGIANCRQTFQTVESFRRHGWRKHSDKLRRLNRIINGNSLEQHASDQDSDSEIADTAGNREDSVAIIPVTVTHSNPSTPTATPPPSVQASGYQLAQVQANTSQHLCDAFVSLREQNLLPDSVTRACFDQLQSVFTNHHSGMMAGIEASLSARGYSECIPNDSSELADVFRNPEYTSAMFRGVSSEYRISKHVRENMHFIPPRTECLGETGAGVKINYQYISIRSVLGTILGFEDVVAEVMNFCESRNRPDNVYQDFQDGSEYSRRMADSSASNTVDLYLIMYTDEYETVNPIGSSKKKHKLSAVYYTLACLPPHVRSKRKFTFLAALCKDKYRKQFGYQALFRNIISELNSFKDDPILARGIAFVPRLLVICGDNLSAHALGGFQQSFNSGKICRLCMMDYTDIYAKFDPDSFVMRDNESHKNHIQQVVENSIMSRQSGMKGPSCLSELTDETMNVLTMLPNDCMHDCLEGVFVIVITSVLFDLILKKVITLADVNSAINEFANSYKHATDLNVFNVEITRIHLLKRKLTGTASQKWFLLIYLPFILGSKVDGKLPSWRLLMKCREIADILLAHTISKSQIVYLKTLIIEHHALLLKVSPSSFTPKCHFLAHYPYLITLYGPPRRFWTMRFESVHQYFKDLARRIRNFRNIPLTLATRYQTLLASHLSSQSFMQTNRDLVVGPGKTRTLSVMPSDIREEIRATADLGLYEDLEEIFCCDWLSHRGYRYNIGSIVVTFIALEEEFPVMTEITHIMNIHSTWYIGGKDVTPSHFDSHTWSYVCIRANSHSVTPLRELPDVRPTQFYHAGNACHVILPHQLPK